MGGDTLQEKPTKLTESKLQDRVSLEAPNLAAPREFAQRPEELQPRQLRRDVANFVKLRVSTPADDPAIGDFLLRTFLKTYEQKLPHVQTSDDRKRDLLNVSAKRKVGTVCVLELGYKIVGTFSLIHPESEACEAWLDYAANLRCVAVDLEFQGLRFADILLAEAHRIARLWQMAYVCLHVLKGADPVAKLYQSHGYERDTRGDGQINGQELEGYTLCLQ